MRRPRAGFIHVPEREIRQADMNRSWNFAKGTLFPLLFPTATPPADPYEPTSSIVQVLINMSAPVKEQVPAADSENCPNSTGLILALPLRDYTAIWHMGFVPANTLARYGDASLGGFYETDGPNPYMEGITYISQLALPYGQSATNYTITFSPDLAENFNRLRVFSHMYEIVSGTTSTNANTISGKFNAAVVPDTVSIAQKNNVAFSTVELVTAASMAKQKVQNIKALDGVVVVLGDDLKQNFEEPNQFAVDKTPGSWSVIYRTSVQKTFDTNLFTPGAGTQMLQSNFALENFWVSPRAIGAAFWNNAALSSPTGGFWAGASWPIGYGDLNITNTNGLDQIGEADFLDFRVSMLVQEFNASDTVPWETQIVANARHCFASIDDPISGRVVYRWVSETQCTPIINSQSALNGASKNYNLTWEFGSQIGCGLSSMSKSAAGECEIGRMPGVEPSASANSGKYIGSIVNLSLLLLSEVPISSIVGARCFLYTNGVSVAVKPHGGAERGHRGPAHIIRYDNVASGQDLELSGVANCQAVNQSDLTQVSKMGSFDQRSPANQNALGLVHALYNGSEHHGWKSVWAAPDYYNRQAELSGMSYEDFARGISDSVHVGDTVMAHTEASGFFKDLGSTIGGVVDHLTQASGQFGSDAAGQFGFSNDE